MLVPDWLFKTSDGERARQHRGGLGIELRHAGDDSKERVTGTPAGERSLLLFGPLEEQFREGGWTKRRGGKFKNVNKELFGRCKWLGFN